MSSIYLIAMEKLPTSRHVYNDVGSTTKRKVLYFHYCQGQSCYTRSMGIEPTSGAIRWAFGVLNFFLRYQLIIFEKQIP